MLAYFAMLLWVLVAIAALTVDLGLVRTSQRQMQSLTDQAAMEATYNLDQPADARAAAANAIIATAMNDTQSGDAQCFGAGPEATVAADGTSPAVLVNPSVNNPARQVYQPTLQTNAANDLDGDIVAGTYTPSATTANPEAGGYTRPDFVNDSTAPDSVLVRLRRSSAYSTPDGVRSSGPPLPFLFAQGSMMNAVGKAQGVTVRATAIAAARPVLSAGPVLLDTANSPPAYTIPGVAPLALSADFWLGTAAATATVAGGTVSNITLTSAGMGYTSAPTVVLSGGGGSGAAATASVDPTKGFVTSVTLTSGGSGYTSAPMISFSGGGSLGATATASVSGGSVTGITVTNGGSYYAYPPNVYLSGGGGSGATAVVNPTGWDPKTGVTAIQVTNGGTGYTSAPIVSFQQSQFTLTQPSTATASATVAAGAVTSVPVTNAGSGYSSSKPPTVFFVGGGGSGGAATATVDLTGAVTSIAVQSGGSGYTSPPLVLLSGVGATGTATLSGGSVTNVTITNGGSGYSSAAQMNVVFSGGGGSGATGTATVAGGVVTSVTITSGGSGYTSAPAVSFSGAGVQWSNSGKPAGYSIAQPTGVTILAAPLTRLTTPAMGSIAIATATVDTTAGSVTGVTLPSGGGSGYTAAPPVFLLGGAGQGATAAATINPSTGTVMGITVSNGGTGYTSAPTVSLVGPYVPVYSSQLPDVVGGFAYAAIAQAPDGQTLGLITITNLAAGNASAALGQSILQVNTSLTAANISLLFGVNQSLQTIGLRAPALVR